MFRPGSDERRSSAIRSFKAAARSLLGAADDDAVVVSELSCTEPGCPPIETVVALLREGSRPRQVKVHKPAVEATEDDLRAAIRGSNEHAHLRG
jgi:hypothetical protein